MPRIEIVLGSGFLRTRIPVSYHRESAPHGQYTAAHIFFGGTTYIPRRHEHSICQTGVRRSPNPTQRYEHSVCRTGIRCSPNPTGPDRVAFLLPAFSMALWRGRAAGMFQDPRPQLRSVERHMSPVMTFQEPLHWYNPDHNWAFRDSCIQPSSPLAVVHICDSRVLCHRDRA